MSEVEGTLDNLGQDESLTFSGKQIEYLRSEFDRQRRWVNLLSSREKNALEELEQTRNSLSYQIGRFLTWGPRKINKMLFRQNKKIVYFVEEDEGGGRGELFPSSLLITPELLPSESSSRKADSLIEEILITVRRGSVSVNSIRDTFSEGTDAMHEVEQAKAAAKIIEHMLSSAIYGPSTRNVFVGILRSMAKKDIGNAQDFGERFIGDLTDERAIRTLVQVHGKMGNFSRPLELLKLMPKSAWRKQQQKRFSVAAAILKNGLNLSYRKPVIIKPKGKNVIYHASQSMPHTSSGYAIRTHGLVSSLKKKGYSVDVLL
ncbi:MAG: hypothetical protein OR994_06645, partial [Candidatus Poseidoniales archaeon]|nr:hypothetical protein [Candidatus Poseidoniales archaeon]